MNPKLLIATLALTVVSHAQSEQVKLTCTSSDKPTLQVVFDDSTKRIEITGMTSKGWPISEYAWTESDIDTWTSDVIIIQKGNRRQYWRSWTLNRVTGTLSGSGEIERDTPASSFRIRDLNCSKSVARF